MIKIPTQADVIAWLTANGLKILIVLLLITGAYFKGRDDVNDKLAGQQADVYAKALKLQAREAEVEKKEAELTAVKDSELSAELTDAIGDLDDAIKKAGNNPSCDLTRDELQEFQRLVETTK